MPFITQSIEKVHNILNDSYLHQIRLLHNRPRLIYLTGCDGTGKTTQSQLLLADLDALGVKRKYLWLRFPFFFTIPLLAYARWRGYSWYEEYEGGRHGYWDFRNSWLLGFLFPWALLADASIAAIIKVYPALWSGKTIVCERFVLDMLVDLSLALGEPGLNRRLPGRLYPALLPRQAVVVFLDLDAETIRRRRPDLSQDKRLISRLHAYRRLAADLQYPTISSSKPPAGVNQKIWEVIEKKARDKPGDGYAKTNSRILRKLFGQPIAALLSHWAFQSLFYMDPTERWFKIMVDIVLTIFGSLILHIWLPWWPSLIIAFTIAHTFNFLFNGHVWGVLKHYGFVRHTYTHYEAYVAGIVRRVEKEPAINSMVAFGSRSREEWSPTSDLDARITRRPGFRNGLRACCFLMGERTRALAIRFPLDLYLLDHERSLKGLKAGERPIVLYRRDSWGSGAGDLGSGRI